MTRDCAGPNCEFEFPTCAGLGNIVDPAKADLPFFKVTYDAGVSAHSPRYQTVEFCSLKCQQEWLEQHNAPDTLDTDDAADGFDPDEVVRRWADEEGDDE